MRLLVRLCASDAHSSLREAYSHDPRCCECRERSSNGTETRGPSSRADGSLDLRERKRRFILALDQCETSPVRLDARIAPIRTSTFSRGTHAGRFALSRGPFTGLSPVASRLGSIRPCQNTLARLVDPSCYCWYLSTLGSAWALLSSISIAPRVGIYRTRIRVCWIAPIRGPICWRRRWRGRGRVIVRGAYKEHSATDDGFPRAGNNCSSNCYVFRSLANSATVLALATAIISSAISKLRVKAMCAASRPPCIHIHEMPRPAWRCISSRPPRAASSSAKIARSDQR